MPNKFLAAVALAVLGASASGCSSFGKALGVGKNPPDEFAITTKAPLVIPPDYSLRPPKPGESRPQELSPSERARQVLLGDTSAAPPSTGEQLLLRKAGALNADPNIRALLGAENGGRGEKDSSLANALIFWKVNGSKIDYGEAPLKVDNPEQWLSQREESIESVIGKTDNVQIKKGKALGLPGVF